MARLVHRLIYKLLCMYHAFANYCSKLLWRRVERREDCDAPPRDEHEWMNKRIGNVTDAYAFYEVGAGVIVAQDVTKNLDMALEHHFKKYGRVRDNMGVCDLLVSCDADRKPFFPQMHFRLSMVEAPSINMEVHYGIMIHRSNGRIEAYTNKSRPRLNLTNLDDKADWQLPSRETLYEVVSVLNPDNDQVIEAATPFLKRLLRPQIRYRNSLPQLLAMYFNEDELDDCRVSIQRKIESGNQDEDNNLNEYEQLVLHDMATCRRLNPQPLKCTVLDNTPEMTTFDV